MRQVRLRLAAFANMMSAILRIGASLLFIIVAARRLGVDGFAALGIILSLYQAIPLLSHVWHWWAQRQAGELDGDQARIAAGTGLSLSLAVAPLAGLVYMIVAWATMKAAGLPVEAALLASPAVSLYTIARYLNGIIAVRRPELVGIIGLTHEAAKLLAAIVLIAGMGLGLKGAVLSLDIAALTMLLSALYIYRGLKVWGLAFDRRRVRYWFSKWRLPVLLLILNMSQSLVRPLYTWTTGLLRPVAYLNMGLSVATPMVRVGQSMVPGLYARALRGGGAQDLEESLRIYILFLAYVVALVVGASRPLASVFNPVYMDGHLVLVAGALYALAVGLTVNYRVYVLGATGMDDSGYGRMLRLVMVEIVVFVAGLVAGALASLEAGSSWEAAVAYLGIAAIARLTPLLLYHRLAAREGFKFPWRTVAEVSAGALASLAFLRLSGVERIVILEMLLDGPRLAAYLVASALVYLGVVLVVSPWARGLAERGIRLAGRAFS